jgi:raffinose/stachyose/melibiose transport system permease protein
MTKSARVNKLDQPNRLLYIVAGMVLLIVVIPLLFALLGGFRDNGQLASNPAGFPSPWVNDNYIFIAKTASFWKQAGNSVLIALITTFVVLPAASLAAFITGRYRFFGSELTHGLFTLGLLFPLAVAILPLFIVLRQMHLLNNPFGVALPQAAFALPLSIVIMRPFFKAIPDDIQDAAAIDGCTPWRFYWAIMLPLSRPVLSTVAVLTIVTSWNAFLLPLLILNKPERWTVPIGVNNVSGQFAQDTSKILAYTAMSMIPALIFYAIAERQIVSGLTAGAVKE